MRFVYFDTPVSKYTFGDSFSAADAVNLVCYELISTQKRQHHAQEASSDVCYKLPMQKSDCCGPSRIMTDQIKGHLLD